MHRRLIIIGAGGHGKVLADIAFLMRSWELIVFLDDNISSLKGTSKNKIIGRTVDFYNFVNDSDFIVGIGDNHTRGKIHKYLESADASIVTLIHPFSSIGTNVTTGTGSVVMPGAVINCYSRIGKGCIINTSASIDHDSYLEDFVHISPGVRIAGNVKIGKYSWIGIGCNIINDVTITNNCIIGAGALVVKDINVEGTYVGVPARKI